MIDSFDIEKFLSTEFEVSKSGTNLVFDCPFCGDKRKNYWFDINKKYIHRKNNQEYKGLGQCFRCTKNHNVLTFIMEYKKYDLIRALNFINGDSFLSLKDLKRKLYNNSNMNIINSISAELTQTINIPLPENSTNDLPNELINWFTKIRSYPADLLKELDVKYCNNFYKPDFKFLKYRAIFPIVTNKNSAWQAYLFRPSDNYPKTRNPSGPVMRSLLYLYDVMKNDKCILVNEGIFDSLRCFSRGKSAVALLGKNLSLTQCYYLGNTNADEICMCLDGGEKEEFQAIKNCNRLDNFFDGEITIMRLPRGVDPDDVDKSSFLKAFLNRVKFLSNRVVFDGLGKISGYNW